MKKIILLNIIFICRITISYAQNPGDLDSSFGENGIAISAFGIETYFTTMAVQGDGKVVAAGYTFNGSPNLIVARYNIDGTTDNTFSEDGIQISSYFSSANSVVIQQDGKIVLAAPGSILRYNSDGSFDNTFIRPTPFDIISLAIQSDGKILGVGYATNGSNFDITLVRYNIDGSLDNSFSDDGKQTTDFGGSFDEAHCVAIQSDGKIIIAGSSDFNFAVARYNIDGSLDLSFSGDGKQTTDFGSSEDGTSLAIQVDGKIIVGGNTYINNEYAFCLARYNTDGSLDNGFSNDGKQIADFTSYAFTIKNSVAIQSNGKILMGGNSSVLNDNLNQFTLIRYNINGSIDLTFSRDGIQTTDISEGSGLLYTIGIGDSKLYAVGFGQILSHRGIIARYVLDDENKAPTISLTAPANNTTYTAYGYIKINLNANASDADGTISKVEFYSNSVLLHTEYVAPYGYIWHNVAAGNYAITAKATDNNGNVTTSDAVHISVVPDKAPTVKITSPANGASYRAYSSITLRANANDMDGTIKKIDFYNGNTLIFTETVAPFERKGYRLPLGNYSITAKATDNNGRVTTSQPVAISVVSNIAPVVSITSPANHTTYVFPATIILSADASDIDGTIKKVDFYNGSTLLFTENDAPYFRSWPDVAEGNYSITAIATDNDGKTTASAPVGISVIAANKSLAKQDKLNSSKEPLSLNLNPNPVANILNISVHGLQTNSRSIISVLSVSGSVIKTIQPGALNKNVQLDVSSLSGGVYFIKVISGDKIFYKQFVKL